ncbi:MAG: hypothetical protein IPL42_02540 [Saprospiraceae bacterium]|nr:hypothetical protein [Saprospiraceae bacterium]
MKYKSSLFKYQQSKHTKSSPRAFNSLSIARATISGARIVVHHIYA